MDRWIGGRVDKSKSYALWKGGSMNNSESYHPYALLISQRKDMSTGH